jgi:hypothetical protein
VNFSDCRVGFESVSLNAIPEDDEILCRVVVICKLNTANRNEVISCHPVPRQSRTACFWFDLHRGENVRRTAAAMLVLVVGISLSGCMAKTLSLNSSEVTIPRCSPNPPIKATALSSQDRAQCDAEGAVIVFPDGMHAKAPQILGVRSESTQSPHSTSDTYTTYNLGIYGVVAVQVPRLGGQPYFWGSPHGLKLKLY